MKEFALQQQSEVKKAIIGGGKYKIREACQALEVVDGTWWRRITDHQRQTHIKKFNN